MLFLFGFAGEVLDNDLSFEIFGFNEDILKSNFSFVFSAIIFFWFREVCTKDMYLAVLSHLMVAFIDWVIYIVFI